MHRLHDDLKIIRKKLCPGPYPVQEKRQRKKGVNFIFKEKLNVGSNKMTTIGMRMTAGIVKRMMDGRKRANGTKAKQTDPPRGKNRKVLRSRKNQHPFRTGQMKSQKIHCHHPMFETYRLYRRHRNHLLLMLPIQNAKNDWRKYLTNRSILVNQMIA